MTVITIVQVCGERQGGGRVCMTLPLSCRPPAEAGYARDTGAARLTMLLWDEPAPQVLAMVLAVVMCAVLYWYQLKPFLARAKKVGGHGEPGQIYIWVGVSRLEP